MIPTIFKLEARILSCNAVVIACNAVVIGSHHSNCPFRNGVNTPYCARKAKISHNIDAAMQVYQENKNELTETCPLVQDENLPKIMKDEK